MGGDRGAEREYSSRGDYDNRGASPALGRSSFTFGPKPYGQANNDQVLDRLRRGRGPSGGDYGGYGGDGVYGYGQSVTGRERSSGMALRQRGRSTSGIGGGDTRGQFTFGPDSSIGGGQAAIERARSYMDDNVNRRRSSRYGRAATEREMREMRDAGERRGSFRYGPESQIGGGVSATLENRGLRYDGRPYDDQRYEDRRFSNQRDGDRGYDDRRYGDQLYDEERYDNRRNDDRRYGDSRGGGYDDQR